MVIAASVYRYMHVSVHNTCMYMYTVQACICTQYMHVSVHSTCMCLYTVHACICTQYVHVSVHSTCMYLYTVHACVCTQYVHVSVHSTCMCLYTVRACVCGSVAVSVGSSIGLLVFYCPRVLCSIVLTHNNQHTHNLSSVTLRKINVCIAYCLFELSWHLGITNFDISCPIVLIIK